MPLKTGVTLNNVSDYWNNGLYRTPNPNRSPFVYYGSPLVRCIIKCNRENWQKTAIRRLIG